MALSLGWRGVYESRGARWTLGVLAALVLLGGLAAAGWKLSLSRRQRTAVAATQIFLQRHDLPRAIQSLQRALELGPPTAEVCRVAAELGEQRGSADALAWRERALSEAGATPRDRCLLAQAAVRAGQLPLAERTLAALPAPARAGVEFHQAAGELAWARNQPAEAERHWVELVRLEPEKPAWRLALATVRILAPEPRAAEAARAELERLRAVPELHLAALRVLVRDARAHPPGPGSAEALVKEFAAAPGKVLADHLLLLEMLRELSPAEFSRYLSGLQASPAAQQPRPAALLLSWMNDHGLAAEALAWAAKLPKETNADPRTSFSVADALVHQRDWGALEERLTAADWQEMDFMRRFMLAHVWREKGEESAARAQLETVAAAAARAPDDLRLLLEFSRRWGWAPETERLEQGSGARP